MESHPGYTARNCFDGLARMPRPGALCHGITWSANPWLRVDLSSTAEVRIVRVFNRRDCCVSRFGNHQIFVGDAGNVNVDKKCFTGTAPNTVGPFNDPCSGSGRYVTIVLPGARRLINLLEVEVWGFGKIHVPLTTTYSPAPFITTLTSMLAFRSVPWYIAASLRQCFTAHL
jgi:hypothetical protein